MTEQSPRELESSDWLAALQDASFRTIHHPPGEPSGVPGYDAKREAALARRVALQQVLQSLKELRVATGLTQTQIAELWGRPQSSVSRLETNPERAEVGTLIAYLAAIGGHLAIEAEVDGELLRVELA